MPTTWILYRAENRAHYKIQRTLNNIRGCPERQGGTIKNKMGLSDGWWSPQAEKLRGLVVHLSPSTAVFVLSCHHLDVMFVVSTRPMYPAWILLPVSCSKLFVVHFETWATRSWEIASPIFLIQNNLNSSFDLVFEHNTSLILWMIILHLSFSQQEFSTKNKVLVTGTPLQNSVEELWYGSLKCVSVSFLFVSIKQTLLFVSWVRLSIYFLILSQMKCL
jgi:hypothetical protein